LTASTVASSERSNATKQHDDDGDGHDEPIEGFRLYGYNYLPMYIPFSPCKSFSSIKLITVDDISLDSGAVDASAKSRSYRTCTSGPQDPCKTQANEIQLSDQNEPKEATYNKRWLPTLVRIDPVLAECKKSRM
jgi:hypothetical protein